jgi:deazaflavin-dependent oxidoreductase (nitroreductase family)
MLSGGDPTKTRYDVSRPRTIPLDPERRFEIGPIGAMGSDDSGEYAPVRAGGASRSTAAQIEGRGLRTDVGSPTRPLYLYLTTTGRVTGQPREIEIWFTEHAGRFYLVAERESANWVRNVQSQPQVKVRVGYAEFNAIARVVRNDREPHLAATVKALFDAKYGWSDGLIAELTPA